MVSFKEIAKLFLVKQIRVSRMMNYVACNTRSGFMRKIIKKRLDNKYHIVISDQAIIGEGVKVPHPQNIIIGGHVEIGDRCTIYQDVTLGQNRSRYPKIGNDVVIYPGAKVIGNVRIGDQAVIGANAVVVKDVPSRAVMAGIPAKEVSFRRSLDEFY